jgi:hypothetical protein
VKLLTKERKEGKKACEKRPAILEHVIPGSLVCRDMHPLLVPFQKKKLLFPKDKKSLHAAFVAVNPFSCSRALCVFLFFFFCSTESTFVCFPERLSLVAICLRAYTYLPWKFFP